MRKYITLLLMIAWVAVMLVLSFENGTETAQTSHDFTTKILRFVTGEEPTWEMIVMWDSKFRLYAHVGIFLVYGLISMLVLLDWIKGITIPFLLSGISGIVLGVMSEVGKLRIEGRHCDIGEMQLNVLGAVLGTMFCYGVVQLMKMIKEKRFLLVVSTFLLFGLMVFVTPHTSQAYTEAEKQQAKAWLSANGYSPDMGGANQAYQDYLNGKFDEMLGQDINGDGYPAPATEAGTGDSSQEAVEGSTEISSENIDDIAAENGLNGVTSETAGAGGMNGTEAVANGQSQTATSEDGATTEAVTEEATSEATEETTTESEEATTEVTTEEATEEEDSEENSGNYQIIILVVVLAVALVFLAGLYFKKKK